MKGLLRVDKDQRWTPLMAKEHPLITNKKFQGHFEPIRESERQSTTEDDSLSYKSSSSKDSKDYKIGSCPSKIMYPATSQTNNSVLFLQ